MSRKEWHCAQTMVLRSGVEARLQNDVARGRCFGAARRRIMRYVVAPGAVAALAVGSEIEPLVV